MIRNSTSSNGDQHLPHTNLTAANKPTQHTSDPLREAHTADKTTAVKLVIAFMRIPDYLGRLGGVLVGLTCTVMSGLRCASVTGLEKGFGSG